MTTIVNGNVIASGYRAKLGYDVVDSAASVSVKLGADSSTDIDHMFPRSYPLEYVGGGPYKCDSSTGTCNYSISVNGTAVWSTSSTGSNTVVTIGQVINSTINKTHAQQSITLEVKTVWSNYTILNDSYQPIGTRTDTTTASTTITVPAIASYVVSFNANGGSGAPASQTKWYGESLTLSSTQPTRSGHKFVGWATSPTSTTVAYAAGASYTGNAALSLYAVWQKMPVVTDISAVRVTQSGIADEVGGYVKVTASYQSDYVLSATGAVVGTQSASGGSKSAGTGTLSIIVGDGTLSPLNSYNVSISATSTAGTTTATLTLQASSTYFTPTITNVSVKRVASSSSTTEDDLGRYLYASFDYSVFSSSSQTAPSSVSVRFARAESSSRSITASTANATITTHSSQFAYSTIAPGTAYADEFSVTVTDKFGYATVKASLGTGSYFIPQVSSVESYRSDTSGVSADEGKTATVTVDWAVTQTGTQTAPQSLVISAYTMANVLVASRTLSPNTASGASVITFVSADRASGSGNDIFDIDQKYKITAVLTDKYTSSEKSDTLTAAFFTMDFLSGGHGIGIGKPATRNGLDVGMQAYFDNIIKVAEHFSLPVYEFATTPVAADLPITPCFAITDDGHAYICTESGGTVTITEIGGNGGVTGVKGDAESTYRTGNVNITAANIGAAAASHDHSGQALTPASVTATGAIQGSSISDGTGTLAQLRESVSPNANQGTFTVASGSRYVCRWVDIRKVGNLVHAVIRINLSSNPLPTGDRATLGTIGPSSLVPNYYIPRIVCACAENYDSYLDKMSDCFLNNGTLVIDNRSGSMLREVNVDACWWV